VKGEVMKKHFRSAILSVISVLLVTGALYAAGDLLRIPDNFASYPGSPMPIQQCAPTTGVYKSVGTGSKGSFANYSVASVTCLDVVGTTATGAIPVPVALKYRYNGFTTGKEKDFMILPTTGGRIWAGNGVKKIGFMPYSTATTPTTAYVVGGKM